MSYQPGAPGRVVSGCFFHRFRYRLPARKLNRFERRRLVRGACFDCGLPRAMTLAAFLALVGRPFGDFQGES